MSGRELRALASGTQVSSLALAQFILIKKITLAVRTFVWTINNRPLCVVLQSAVPVDEVHHVLCHRDGGYVDGEALLGEEVKGRCYPTS